MSISDAPPYYAAILLLFSTVFLFVKEKQAAKKVKQLQEDAKLKNDFMHTTIHELRAPLTAIKDSSKLIVDTPTLDKIQVDKLLSIIHEQSKKMLDQVSLLLDAAKFEAGKFVLEKTQGDFRKLVEEKMQVFIPQAQEKKVNLSSDLGQPLPLATFDQIRMGQVVNNLLSNSLKYTPEGGSITVTLRQKTLRQIELTVADTGIGIPKEKQATLFSKFYQIQGSDGQQRVGSGLGLYITKSIIEAHGGEIFLQSEPGKGTTISFTLPI